MRIVIGVDGSQPSRVACDLVASRSWPAGSTGRLVGVLEQPIPWVGASGKRDADVVGGEAGLLTVLDEHADDLRRAGLACEVAVVAGPPAQVLVSEASDWFADLVVVGNRGRGAAASAVLGSVSAHLVDHAPCPVLVARGPRIERMLLATDGSRSCLDVPRMLARWRPAFHGMEVEVISIADGGRLISPSGTEGDLAEHRLIAAEVADEMLDLGWSASAVARAGDPSREIVHAAEGYGADLVVTGSRCLSTLGRLLNGSVAHAVLLHGHTSMLVMRGHVPARVPQAAFAAAAGTG